MKPVLGIRLAAVAAAATVAVAVAPRLADAEPLASACHANNGDTHYGFKGSIETGPNNAHSFKALKYTAQFSAADDDPTKIPADADNDVYLQIQRHDNGHVYHSTHSPDTLDYFVPHTFDINWVLPRGVLMFGRFTPWFDKRGVPDVSCRADTQPFIYEMPDANTWQTLCNKTDDAACRLVDPGR